MERIDRNELAGIVPCWACGGKLIFDREAAEGPRNGWYYFCHHCGRHWFVEAGGNPDTIVLRVSIPEYSSGLSWRWNQRRDKSDAAWDAYMDNVLRLGDEPALREEWSKRQ